MISLPLIAYRLYDVGLKKSANTSVHFFFFLSFFKKKIGIGSKPWTYKDFKRCSRLNPVGLAMRQNAVSWKYSKDWIMG